MSKSSKFLEQFNEDDNVFDEHPGIYGHNMDKNDLEQMLLQARINQQKSRAARALADRDTVFKVEAYERNAHSPLMHEWVATLKEAKRIAKSWTKAEGYYFEEICITKYRRPASWPRSYGFKDIIPIGSLKKTIRNWQDVENGPIQSEIKWVWS